MTSLIHCLAIDADVLREQVNNALVRIGTVEVIERLEDFIPGQSWDTRLFADDPFEHIKRPESEAALVRLLEVEKSGDLRAHIGVSLCMLCAEPPVLENVRDLLAAGRLNEQFTGLEEYLLAAGTMVGYAPPDAKKWREALERREQRTANPLSDKQTLQTLRSALPTGGKGASAPAPNRAFPTGPGGTSRKIGRNAPCPCGSGKKYKKCCLNRTG